MMNPESIEFQEIPSHYKTFVIYFDGTDFVKIAETDNFVTLFKWDGYSASWNTETTYRKQKRREINT